jgi:hypothetical protein
MSTLRYLSAHSQERVYLSIFLSKEKVRREVKEE